MTSYLASVEKESQKAAKKVRSSIRNYGAKLKIEQSMLQRQHENDLREFSKRNSSTEIQNKNKQGAADRGRLSPDVSIVFGGIKKTKDKSVDSLNATHMELKGLEGESEMTSQYLGYVKGLKIVHNELD